jgi:hypothetical protein
MLYHFSSHALVKQGSMLRFPSMERYPMPTASSRAVEPNGDTEEKS